MASLRFVRDVAAPPDVVFDILTDHRRYAEFTPARSSELEREGDPPPNGVGAIRVIRSLGPPLREEVLTYEPPRRFSYRILSGVPLRDHVATVELTPKGDATTVTYAVRTMPTLPFGAGAAVAVTRMAVRQLLNGIAAEAERRAAVPNV
jgi:uncharacterized protein YndB with AHSA1/START domain